MRAARAHDTAASPTFSLWKIPGRKRMAHAGTQLSITAQHGPHRLLALLSTELEDGAPCGFAVPLDAHVRTQLAGYQAQARAIQGQWPPVSGRKLSRASMLHLRALQALDASQAGARHRDIAEALFGPDAVRQRWTADGELRAQLRHILARAEGLMRGGYLALAGVRPGHTSTPGDEPTH